MRGLVTVSDNGGTKKFPSAYQFHKWANGAEVIRRAEEDHNTP